MHLPYLVVGNDYSSIENLDSFTVALDHITPFENTQWMLSFFNTTTCHNNS